MRVPSARVLDIGDSAPFVRALDHAGTPVASNADLVTGKPLLLLFCPSAEDPGLTAGLQAFRGAADRLAAVQAGLFIVSRAPVDANAALRKRLDLPFPILADLTGEIYKAYGIDPYPATPSLALVMLDPGHRVARVLERMEAVAMAAEALSELERLKACRPATRLQAHPPVLVLRRMLSPEDCAFLAATWARDVPEYATDGFTNVGTKTERGDYKVVHDGAYGRAVEYIVRDEGLQRFIDGRMRRRLLPEINKAFQAKELRREGYRIAGYEARQGGFLNPHRDNSTPANAHRRFTMTVNLNAGEYEGGELRFREYGEELYTVERGTAVVWSASLLHEVLPVTKGRRLVLGVHMFAG
ncbi:MAG: 2OG-Fe(II) oxygenase [Dongiaceae bacterium]